MNILGREVTARKYGNLPLINAYVALKTGDCKKEMSAAYVCLDNCEKRFITARFVQGQPISVKAIVPGELRVREDLCEFVRQHESAESFMQALSQQSGYRLIVEGNKQSLFYQDDQVAFSIPCGYSNKAELWSSEVQQSLGQLCSRFGEVEAIAENVLLERLVEDKALSAQLMNPMIMQMMSSTFGSEGERLVRILREAQARRN
ncbi:hypothetical protein HN592_02330 [Candidatus Woesearchaeota archaeon]|jgi:hypothetical protein|nr:hypothetical protein [Candidatus Woesearchaeota archaeon]MBT4368049.1 hypothetical protein [Candidatus Woesearchaeota archaeon]MBT4712537.1 hypothetical protein [Candidatus Woesearchaeota archaeon]MBT6639450.1 hypothetical protein [Candidatus Woesearchaeota archaeon]MBT7133622.1 hypothetical protein [Candidatus Woesearchaeota archaeon]